MNPRSIERLLGASNPEPDRADVETPTVTIRPPVEAAELPTPEAVDDSVFDTERDPADVFPQSVASGGPTFSGVILWTRIHPAAYDHTETLLVEVATDESFADTVVSRELKKPGVKPDDNYTIRVDLNELLDPDSVYYYRFSYGGVRSRTGRCRTLPATGAEVESVRLGLLNCQNYQNGYFGAMAHLAEADVDFVLHLGDYIYEHVAKGYPNGENGPYADRRISLPDGETLPMSLADFQTIYETYKNDPLLQRLHERHTVIQTWDDHAIANNRYWDYEADAPVFPNHPCGDAPEFTRYLTRAGIQAWWEFVPGRIMYDRDADHIQESFELYRSVEFGDLVTLLLTDERLFRSRPLSLVEKARRTERADPNRSMLGSEQREWFLSEVRTTDARWAVWANAVLFTPFTLGLRWLTPGSDSWDGFVAERTSIMETFEAVSRRGETTVVTLTGDMHTTLATRVRTDEPDATPVAVEFMTPGVTSVNFSERVADKLGRLSRSTRVGTLAGRVAPKVMHRIMRRLNTDYALLDSAHWGYSTVEFTPDACTWDVYWVDKTVNAADAQADHYYRVRVPAGEYVLQDLSSEARDDGGTRSSSSGGRLHHSTTTDDAGRTRSSIEPEP